MSTGHLHLTRRGAIYRLRRRLPTPLNTLLSRSHHDVSLGTAEPACARRLARQLTAAIDRLAETLAAMPKADLPTPGQLNLLLKRMFAEILSAGTTRRQAAAEGWEEEFDTRPHQADPDHESQIYAKLAATVRDGAPTDADPDDLAAFCQELVTANDSAIFEPRLDRALMAASLALPNDDPLYHRLCRDAGIVVAYAYRTDAERQHGDYGDRQTFPPYIDECYPVHSALLRAQSGNFSNEEVDFLARRIGEVGEEYITKHLRQVRAGKTERDWRTALKYFIALVGNLRIGEITPQHVNRFRDRLLDVPAEFGKGLYDNMPPDQAIALVGKLRGLISQAKASGSTELRLQGRLFSLAQAERKTVCLSQKTANKHLSFFTSLWRSRLVPTVFTAANPFAGSLYTKRQIAIASGGAVGRTEFTNAELHSLFTSPAWTGCQSLKHRSKAGTHLFADAYMMAPLIAVFTGMRREEVAQLKVEDFDYHGDIWFVRVQPTEGRKLKAPASRRDIPIHSELIKIGLKEFVEHRQRGFLFPELQPSPGGGPRGEKLGKWFCYYRRHIPTPLARAETDFPSLRTSFTQRLRREGVALDQIKPITGHQENDVTLRHYAPAFSLEQKQAVIERLDIGVGFPQLYNRMPALLEAMEAAGPATARRPGLRQRAPKTHVSMPTPATE